MKAIRVMAVLIIAGLAFVATAEATPTYGTGGYDIACEVFYTNLGGGLHEYQYDLFAKADHMYYDKTTLRFEFGDGGSAVDHILNMYDPGTGPELREYWTMQGITHNHAGKGWYGEIHTGAQASYGDSDSNTWTVLPTTAEADFNAWIVDPVYAMAEGFDNPFHLPRDYAKHINNPYHEGAGYADAGWGNYAGVPVDDDADGLADDLLFDMEWYFGGTMFNWSADYELVATFRIVSDLGPYGEMTFWNYSSGISITTPIVGPGIPEPATMSLLALGGLAAVLRRRKK